jgi:hypothetical protein
MTHVHARVAAFVLSMAVPGIAWGCSVLRGLARRWDL